jgi:hypothetical protein
VDTAVWYKNVPNEPGNAPALLAQKLHMFILTKEEVDQNDE